MGGKRTGLRGRGRGQLKASFRGKKNQQKIKRKRYGKYKFNTTSGRDKKEKDYPLQGEREESPHGRHGKNEGWESRTILRKSVTSPKRATDLRKLWRKVYSTRRKATSEA